MEPAMLLAEMQIDGLVERMVSVDQKLEKFQKNLRMKALLKNTKKLLAEEFQNKIQTWEVKELEANANVDLEADFTKELDVNEELDIGFTKDLNGMESTMLITETQSCGDAIFFREVL
ncbi:hypothetical protein AVEN_109766-1 [Araneus ventricosus]|uniref:Uncharacterized protein n=1 Tax=Araneus ventricosus TaxID=182803 RepID=A0A4Y2P585_ARAVE|nr:hypothetical protein AVEN_109766-1 [Araneus ventricosus]